MVVDFVFEFVMAGMMMIRPIVQMANRIHSVQPMHPRFFVVVSVTG